MIVQHPESEQLRAGEKTCFQGLASGQECEGLPKLRERVKFLGIRMIRIGARWV